MESKNSYIVLKIIAFVYMVISIPSLLVGIILVLVSLFGITIALISGKWAVILVSLPFFASSMGFFLAGVGLLAIREFIHLAISVEESVVLMASSSGPRIPIAQPLRKKQKVDLSSPMDIDELEEELFDDEEFEEDELHEDEIDLEELDFNKTKEPDPVIETPPVPTPPPVKPKASQSNSISLTCPHCGRTAIAPAKVIGKKVRCRGCEEKFIANEQDRG